MKILQSCSQLLLAGSLIVSSLSAASPSELEHMHDEDQASQIEALTFYPENPFGDVYTKPRSKEPKIFFKDGDLTLQIGGKFRADGNWTKNVNLLNDNIPDSYEFYRQTFDLNFDLSYGEDTWGYEVFELYADIRTKILWGDSGKVLSTTKTPLKLNDAVFGSHSHKADKPLIWARSVWLNIDLPALVGYKPDKEYTQSLKVGFFPFDLGRGISLGTIYGLNKEFLGLYTGYLNDQHAPGINLAGHIVRDILRYDLYYAKLEELSDSLSKTFNHLKASHVGRQATPFRGTGRDNDLYAARLFITPFAAESPNGYASMEPYVLYNSAKDRKIEIEADADSNLGTGGCAFEYKVGSFEFGFDVAGNFGSAKVANIDRNMIQVNANPDTGVWTSEYSEVVVTATGNKAPVTTRNKAVVVTSQNTANGQKLDNERLSNSEKRFRQAFEVKYRGWMGVADTSYEWKWPGLTFAFTGGYATGDANPFLTDTDKTYNGFIGLQEGYVGKRVPSLFILGARKIKRPLTVDPINDNEAGDDETFTDLIFTGGGINWVGNDCILDNKFSISPNALAFWKEAPSSKVDPTTGNFLDEKARSFLGTEFNLRIRYDFQWNFHILFDFAYFFPGGFYDDVRGIKLGGDLFSKLDIPDPTGFESENYRLGNDPSWLVDLVLVYTF